MKLRAKELDVNRKMGCELLLANSTSIQSGLFGVSDCSEFWVRDWVEFRVRGGIEFRVRDWVELRVRNWVEYKVRDWVELELWNR